MKKILIILMITVFLMACDQEVQPTDARGKIPQIEISAPTPLPEKPHYEPPPTAPQAEMSDIEHHIDVTLLDFLPSEIRVRKGDRVRLVLTAREVDQHFYLDAFGIDEELPLGEDVTIEFIAGKAGDFIYRSNTTGMQGILRVN